MEYRYLGNTGLKVSVISFGNCFNSDDPKNQEKVIQTIKKAHSLGINFFDTAEFYGFGEAERQLGVALQQLKIPREDVVISTKLFWEKKEDTLNRVGLSRKHIQEGLKGSLQRLGLDYVDILYCHRFDRYTPLEEVCRSFDSIIKQGKAHYWGTSEWTAAQIFEAFMVCERFNLVKPIVEQVQYNMIIRETFEKDYSRLFDIYKHGSTVWSPLLGGILTGKYNNGFPEDSRINNFKDNPLFHAWYIEEYFGAKNKEKYSKMFLGLGKIAKELGCTQAQLAMAWVIKNKNVSTAITGATRPEQLDDIIGAISLYPKITDEIEARINELTGTQPAPEMDFRTFAPLPPRR